MRPYWSKHVKGDDIKAHFTNRAVGDADRLPGVLNGVDFNTFAMKERDSIMMIMSTYGCLIVNDWQKDSLCEWDSSNGTAITATFKYTETISDHFDYRGALDNHSNKRHNGGTRQGIWLETTWQTRRWDNRLFCFVVAVAEVNLYLAQRYFFGKEE